MKKFIISAKELLEINTLCNAILPGFLKKDTIAFYHDDYVGGRYKIQGTIENALCTLKNDITPYPQETLDRAYERVKAILENDLNSIAKIVAEKLGVALTVCIVPRAKAEACYHSNQRLFRRAVQESIRHIPNLEDGTTCIQRHTSTATTHLERRKSTGLPKPYPGITKKTCHIQGVKDKCILLVDDIYTKSINIDEDAIQALYDHGAKFVILYTIGKTKLQNNYCNFAS